jgi:probable HAF family extracellular repeat protein
MNLRMTRWCIPIALTCALLTTSRTFAQKQNATHHHYKLLDLGTFGGPNSFVNCCGLTPPVLNNRGTVVGGADSSAPNPSSANPNPLIGNEIFVNTAFKWQDGVLTNLGTLPGGYNSLAASINASGQVVGTSENGETDLLSGYPQSHPVLWNHGEVLDLGTLGGYEGVAFQSNHRGLIVGVATNAVPGSFPGFPNCIVYGQQSHAFLWRNGAMQDLGTLGGTDSTAEFVNDRGQIAGASYTNAALNAVPTGCGQLLPTQNPFLWEDGRMIDLGTLGGNFGDVAGINNNGQVAGISDLAGDLTSHAFLWDQESGMKDLGTLGGTFSQADALTEAGEVVGASTTLNDQRFDAFLWKDGVMTDLGILPGDCATGAYAINSKEQIVGDSFLCDGSTRPFLWENGRMISLQDFVPLASGFRLGEPSSINDRGEIVGYGFLSNGDSRAFLLIPCDQDHPRLEGCDYDTVDAETAAEVRPAQITQASARESVPKLSPAEMMTRFRSMMASRYRKFAPLPQQ